MTTRVCPSRRSLEADASPPLLPPSPPQIRFDEHAKVDFGGHDRIETHGGVHMFAVERSDGTKTITFTQRDLLPQGGNLELHWACVMEGSDEWCLPPEGAVLPGGTNDSGDGKASRSPFDGDGKLTMTFPRGERGRFRTGPCATPFLEDFLSPSSRCASPALLFRR
eukprot:31451-Pelagococcus_subviridis.AAC.7